MTEGFILDQTYGAKTQQLWVEGLPQSSFWAGLKTSGRRVFKVLALRCADCGFLEFYTNEEANSDGGFSELFT